MGIEPIFNFTKTCRMRSVASRRRFQLESNGAKTKGRFHMATNTQTKKHRLTEKYRPTKISDFVGHDRIKKVISNYITDPYPTSFLFVGPSGTGKTTLAQALASEIGAIPVLMSSRQCNYDALESSTMTSSSSL